MTTPVWTPSLLDLADLLGDLGRDGRVDPELLLAHQGFAGELQQDATGRRRGHIRTIISSERDDSQSRSIQVNSIEARRWK